MKFAALVLIAALLVAVAVFLLWQFVGETGPVPDPGTVAAEGTRGTGEDSVATPEAQPAPSIPPAARTAANASGRIEKPAAPKREAPGGESKWVLEGRIVNLDPRTTNAARIEVTAIRNRTLSIESINGESGEAGRFELDLTYFFTWGTTPVETDPPLPPGGYRVELFDAKGLVRKSLAATVTAGRTTEIAVVLD